MTNHTAVDILITALRESTHPYMVVRDLYIFGEEVQRLLAPLNPDATIELGHDNNLVAKDNDGEVWTFNPLDGWENIPTTDDLRHPWEHFLLNTPHPPL